MKNNNSTLIAPAILLITFLAGGCASGLGKARTDVHGTSVVAPSNASGPTKVAVAESATRVVVDAGTKVISSLASVSAPATSTVVLPKFELTQETKSNATEVSPPRAPDQSVALEKVAVADRRPLLYAAMACVVLAILIGSPGLGDHPTAGLMIGFGAALFFLAWRAASEPWLGYAAGAAILIGTMLAVGYEICQFHLRKAASTTTTTKPPVAQPQSAPTGS